MSRCRSCDMPVVWAKTTAGKTIPIDATVDDRGRATARPVPDGNLTLIAGEPPRVELVEPGTLFDNDPTGPRYRSHFATCPNADDWRRR